MKLEVSISKGNLFALIAVIIVLAGVFTVYAAISDANAPNHPANQLAVGSGDYNGQSVEQALNALDSRLDDLETFQSGNIVVATALSTVPWRVPAWGTVRSFSVGTSGTINLTYQYRTTYKDRKVNSRIQKINVTGGEEILWTSGSYQSSTAWQSAVQEISVEAGETINFQLNAEEYTSNTQGYEWGVVEMKNVYAKISNKIPVISFSQ